MKSINVTIRVPDHITFRGAAFVTLDRLTGTNEFCIKNGISNAMSGWVSSADVTIQSTGEQLFTEFKQWAREEAQVNLEQAYWASASELFFHYSYSSRCEARNRMQEIAKAEEWPGSDDACEATERYVLWYIRLMHKYTKK